MRVLFLVATAFFALLSQTVSAAPESDIWSIWDQSDESSEVIVNHSSWGEFLKAYIRMDDSGINKLAYRDVSDTDRKKLTQYIDSLVAIDPRGLNKVEQLAYWINLYNALTVDVVLKNPSKDSILRMGEGFFSIGPWDDQATTVAGNPVTLNDIEHRILRPIWQDHRIHYAVNCASIGCPNLAIEAYTAENVEALLNAGERSYINHARGVQFDKKGRLLVSQIFEWYGDDFASNKADFLIYLSMHHETLADQIRNYQGKIKYDYDWNLNTA